MKKLNNNISESYCLFEVSKLLKEKGFDVASSYWDFDKVGILSLRKPTHSLAIEWIRVNFGIHIVAWRYIDDPKKYYFEIDACNILGGNTTNLYNSPQEAIEAALEYTLTHLIK